MVGEKCVFFCLLNGLDSIRDIYECFFLNTKLNTITIEKKNEFNSMDHQIRIHRTYYPLPHEILQRTNEHEPPIMTHLT